MEIINIWATSECNLSCKYCYENKKNKGNGNFQENKIENLIRFIKEINPKIIIFYGGEPLLNFSFIKNIYYNLLNIDPSISYGFTTNGTIYNNEISNFLNKNKENFKNYISISIDGGKETFNINRKSKSEKDIYQNIVNNGNELKKIFPKIRVRMTITPERISYLYEDIRYLADLGYKNIATSFDLYYSKWEQKHFDILYNEYKKIIDFWDKNKELEIGIIKELKEKKIRGKCKLSKSIYIDGSIYPCVCVVGEEKYRMGDIKKGIDNKKGEELIKLSEKNNKLCNNCSNIEYCIYERCKFYNYSLTKELYTPSKSACMFENFKVRFLLDNKSFLL